MNEGEYIVAYSQTYSGDIKGLTEREYVAYVTRGGGGARKGQRFPITFLPANDVLSAIRRGQSGLRSFEASAIPQNTLSTEAFNQNLAVLFLGKIGEAARKFSDENLQTLPPLETAQGARSFLEEYAENGTIFLHPGTRLPFQFNPLFSGRKRAHLRGKSSWILAYEATPAADGSRAVLTLGGKARRVSEAQWEKLSAVSRIGK